jgi:hypothetical protein
MLTYKKFNNDLKLLNSQQNLLPLVLFIYHTTLASFVSKSQVAKAEIFIVFSRSMACSTSFNAYFGSLDQNVTA